MSGWGALASLLPRLWTFITDGPRLHLEPIWEPGDIGSQGRVHMSYTAAEPALRVVNAGRAPCT
jgi:hypothetical protein